MHLIFGVLSRIILPLLIITKTTIAIIMIIILTIIIIIIIIIILIIITVTNTSAILIKQIHILPIPTRTHFLGQDQKVLTEQEEAAVFVKIIDSKTKRNNSINLNNIRPLMESTSTSNFRHNNNNTIITTNNNDQ